MFKDPRAGQPELKWCSDNGRQPRRKSIGLFIREIAVEMQRQVQLAWLRQSEQLIGGEKRQ
jgi:hypothetical protein